jgi:hypothetical protein
MEPTKSYLGVITEATVTGAGMSVTHHLEHASERRGRSRTLIWEKTVCWEPVSLCTEELQCRAERHLAVMGLRALDWFFLDAEGWLPGHEQPDHWYSVVEPVSEDPPRSQYRSADQNETAKSS